MYAFDADGTRHEILRFHQLRVILNPEVPQEKAVVEFFQTLDRTLPGLCRTQYKEWAEHQAAQDNRDRKVAEQNAELAAREHRARLATIHDAVTAADIGVGFLFGVLATVIYKTVRSSNG